MWRKFFFSFFGGGRGGGEKKGGGGWNVWSVGKMPLYNENDDRDVWRGMVANVCSRSGT